jgi:ATP-dependent DNA ligase
LYRRLPTHSRQPDRLDGEAVVCGSDGIAVFDYLHRRQKVTDAMLYAFDLLELNGEDLRSLPLLDRKAKLAKLLVHSRSGIVLKITPTTTAPPCSCTPAKWAWKASCPSA